MSRFLNSNLSKIVPYTPGEQPQGMDKLIKLNTNENPFPPSPEIIKAVSSFDSSILKRYNDPTAKILIDTLAETYDVNSENAFVGNGSDEVLAMIFMALCENGVCYPDITYGFYSVLSGLYNIPETIVPLKADFTIEVEEYKNINATVFIANPNAPTGIPLPISKIEELLNQNLQRLVIVDEAYVDFGRDSSVSLIKKYDNLIVVGTFSKSRSLAGARLGYALANQELIADLNRIKFSFHPYNVNSFTQLVGTLALQDKSYFKSCCDKVAEIRSYSFEELEKIGCEILPSKANFIFVNPVKCSGEEYYQKLRDANILVRYFSTPRLKDFVRITIGTMEEMNTLIEVTKEILK